MAPWKDGVLSKRGPKEVCLPCERYVAELGKLPKRGVAEMGDVSKCSIEKDGTLCECRIGQGDFLHELRHEEDSIFRERGPGKNAGWFEFASGIVGSGENKLGEIRHALTSFAKDALEFGLKCRIIFVGVVRVHRADRLLVHAFRRRINWPPAATPLVHLHRAALLSFCLPGCGLFLDYRVGHVGGILPERKYVASQ